MNIGNSTSSTWIPIDFSGVLNDQQFVPDLTGFSNGGSADPSGIGGSDPTTGVDSSPNATGGWQQTLQNIAALATLSFLSYERGTPQVSTPPATTPAPKPPIVLPSIGGISIGTLLFAAGLGVLAVALGLHLTK